jgi:putative tryptophan/tyrosine transport system substrate-binding protein
VRRRDLLLIGAGTLLTSKSILGARRIPRIGFMASGSREVSVNLLDAFRRGLDELGWVHDRDLIVLDRWAAEHTDRLPNIARELIDTGAEILVTAGTPATLAVRSVSATISIVFVGIGDPVAVGIVSSLIQPGGNATGLSLSSRELITRRLQLLRELVPSMRRLAVIIRNDPGLEQRLLEIRSSSERMGIKTVEFVAATGKALELAFLWLRSERPDALYVASGPLGPSKRAEIVALAAQARIPAIYSFPAFTAAGGLMSLAPDENDLFRRAATYVDRILNGARPADIAVEEPTKFELVVNLKTADALGLAVPQSLLSRAAEVIE